MIRIVYAITNPMAFLLIRGQARRFRNSGFDVTVISSTGPELKRSELLEGVKSVPILMFRELSPFADLKAVMALWGSLRCLRPHLTNVSTPKAGLLGGIAAFFAQVPCRIYVLRGLRFETEHGVKRVVLRLCERIACLCAHRVICVSESLRKKAVEEGLLLGRTSIVLEAGSSNGVDSSRFHINPERIQVGRERRRSLRIFDDCQVVGFVGRLDRDKGLPDLLHALQGLVREYPSLRLLLVGPEENVSFGHLMNGLDAELRDRVITVGPVEDPVPYYHAMDMVAIPSHREGFPNVALEAAAAGKPIVGVRATGTVDAVVHGKTGLLTEVGDPKGLAESIRTYVQSPELRAAHGNAGRERVERDFTQERIWNALEEQYRDLLREKGMTPA